ncbi:MAG: GNAT family N-acetyltransferase [Candidatus Nanopelagicales bacterium]
MRIESGSPLVPATTPEAPRRRRDVVVRDDDETRRTTTASTTRRNFSEHWGWADYPYDDWWEHWQSRASRDPDGWWLALTVDGVRAAICLLDESRADRGEGYVAVLGVLKEFRGRGLARLLLRRAFVHYRDLGPQRDCSASTTNTTGAVALYEKVGMAPVLVMEAYEAPA